MNPLRYIEKRIVRKVISIIDNKIKNFREMQDLRPDFFRQYQYKIITLSDIKADLQIEFNLTKDEDLC